jgi:hypothetical protein
MPATKALDKKWLERENDRVFWRKEREKLAELRRQLREARAARKDAMKAAAERCRSERLAARERARALRIRGLQELREAARLERESARQTCMAEKDSARSKEGIERRRAEIEAEKKYHRELRRIARGHRQRQREHRHLTYIERRQESDDEVRANIAPDLQSLWERVKRGIKGNERMTRTEAFLKYVEEHPDEMLGAIEDKTDALVRQLEARHRDAASHVRRSHRTRLSSSAEAPF